MKASSLSVSNPGLKYYRAPKSFVRRFVAKKLSKSAIIFGLIVGLYMYSKASAYIKAYPTLAAREKIAAALGNNVSIQAMIGVAHKVYTVNGYVVWNFLCLIAAAGAVWGLLLATKYLRGEEDNNRWELMVSGQTTARRATVNTLIGFLSGLTIVYILIYLFLTIIGHLSGVDFSRSSIFFFALCLIAGAGEFIAVGALTSQLMPVRSRATGLAVGVFGVFYAIRAIADTTSAHWMLDISPLGWIERLQPMYASKPLWLIPIAAFIFACIALAIYFSGKRDLGEGIIGEKANIKPKYFLLNGPLGASLRLSKASTIGWLGSVTLLSVVYGQLAKSNIINTLVGSKKANKAVHHLFNSSLTKSTGVIDFLAVAFLFILLIMMFYAAGSLVQARSDEAKGYLDNYVVRPLSRVRWLLSRLGIILSVIILGGAISSTVFWLCVMGQHTSLTYALILKAGLNALVPAILILGIGVFVYGILPRFSALAVYGAIAWSFLIFMLGSGLNFNHWLLDTSVLHHIKFAPAISPNWGADLTILIIGFALMLFGILAFNERDLAGD